MKTECYVKVEDVDKFYKFLQKIKELFDDNRKVFIYTVVNNEYAHGVFSAEELAEFIADIYPELVVDLVQGKSLASVVNQLAMYIEMDLNLSGELYKRYTLAGSEFPRGGVIVVTHVEARVYVVEGMYVAWVVAQQVKYSNKITYALLACNDEDKLLKRLGEVLSCFVY